MSESSLDIMLLIPEITKGMKSIGSKALLTIDKDDKTILEYQIEFIKKNYKNANILIMTGFDYDKIRKKIKPYKNIQIIHNDDYENTNHGKSLKLYINEQKKIKNLLIISNGILLKQKLNTSNEFSILYSLNKKNADYAIGINSYNNEPSYLFYDLPISWSECVYLTKDAVSSIKANIEKQNINQMFLFEIINTIISNKNIFKTETIYNKNIYKINTVKHQKKVKSFI